MAKKRVKIPKAIQDEIMFKSKGLCFCLKRGDHIHHLDNNPANNIFDNLVFLCFKHHEEITTLGRGLRKRFTPAQIKQQRDALYQKNEENSRSEINEFTQIPTKSKKGENSFKASLDAAITIEVLKIHQRYELEDNWDRRADILWELRIYRNHSSIRISHEVFNFISRVSEYARAGMTVGISEAIYNLIIEYFPNPENAREKVLTIKIAETCGHIALGIAYDAFIYLGNFAVANSALEMLKYVYVQGDTIPKIREIVVKTYSDMEKHLERPERKDLEDAKRLLGIYKADLNKPGWRALDNIPDDLMNLIDTHRNKANQRGKNSYHN